MDLAITDLDMDTTDILMLTTERGQLMLSLRLMLTPTSCTEDTMDLDTMVLDMEKQSSFTLQSTNSLSSTKPKQSSITIQSTNSFTGTKPKQSSISIQPTNSFTGTKSYT